MMMILLPSLFYMLLTGPAQTQTNPKVTVDNNSVISTVSSAGTILDQLIQISQINHVPLGIVLKDDAPCRQEVSTLPSSVNTIGNLLAFINKRTSDYHLVIKNGTLVLEPTNLPLSEKEFLALPIRKFSPIETTMNGVNQFLWVWIKAAIRPREGTIGSIMSGSDDSRIAHFEVPDTATVQEILNLLVQQNSGGMWILTPLDNDWQEKLGRVNTNDIEIR